MSTIRQQLSGAITREAQESSARFDWSVIILSAWWMGGLYLDGWAHNHIPQLETFFTPWHAVLYSGFLACAIFLFVAAVRNHAQGYSWLYAMPRGYELSLLGVGIFAAGGVLDMIWHLLFGIERSVSALLSPTHLLLALGGFLTISGPLRAAWQRQTTERKQSLFELLPAILSLAYVLALLSFFTQYANPIIHSLANVSADDETVKLGIVAILLQTGLFMGIVLFAMRRWQLPMGTVAILFALYCMLGITQSDVSSIFEVGVVSLLTGLLVDLLYKALQPSVERREALRLFAFLAPVVIQTAYFLTLFVTGGIVWTVHLWVGAIVIAGVVGLLISFLLVPPPVQQG